MGRLTETFDYLKRPTITADINHLYCSIEITDKLKKLRRKLKLYKHETIRKT